ncbi:unnamed protein product [Haemonchus placei]|uniref:Uncharacterized protein n=1 Tax=Haemonchus placei TaxID=6290 RepID=A0A0N4X7Z2_HAEPC|nr:unnamed protein product [Haemonchus placei]
MFRILIVAILLVATVTEACRRRHRCYYYCHRRIRSASGEMEFSGLSSDDVKAKENMVETRANTLQLPQEMAKRSPRESSCACLTEEEVNWLSDPRNRGNMLSN